MLSLEGEHDLEWDLELSRESDSDSETSVSESSSSESSSPGLCSMLSQFMLMVMSCAWDRSGDGESRIA